MKVLSRLERLDQLESWLKSDDSLILRDAASELGVSLRTIHRDLALLRDRGVPIESERGRGGGVRVASNWGIGRISLTRLEAVDLLVGLTIGEIVQGGLQMGHSGKIKRKILSTFAKTEQRHIAALSRRIRIGGFISDSISSNVGQLHDQVGDELKQAITFNRLLQIRYADQANQPTDRVIELHHLVLNPPAWYAVCWDHLRQGVRTFRCDRMKSAQLLDGTFGPRPWEDFSSAMEGNPTIAV